MPLGVTWSHVIAISGGNRINLTVNGSTTGYAIPSSFNRYGMYFKAGSYHRSSSDSTTNGAKVKFYALTVSHGWQARERRRGRSRGTGPSCSARDQG